MSLKPTIIALMLVASATACTRWSPSTKPLPLAPGKSSSKLRVHMTGGEVLTITGAWQRADSVVGWSQGRGVTLATADITRVEHEVVDGVKTGLFLGGVGAVVAGVIALGSSDGFLSSRVGRSDREILLSAHSRRVP